MTEQHMILSKYLNYFEHSPNCLYHALKRFALHYIIEVSFVKQLQFSTFTTHINDVFTKLLP